MPLFSLPWTLPSDPIYTPTVATFGPLSWVGTHASDGVDLLLEQFRGKPLIEGLLRAFLDQVQAIEDDLWKILLLLDLDQCTDAHLDGVGDLVGEVRRGRADADYREAIRIRIRVNLSNGKHSEILSILETYLGAAAGSGTIELREPAPMALALNVYTVPSTELSDLRVLVRQIKPGTVNLDARVETSATRPARFGWDDGAIAGQTASNGFGWDGDASVGGLFATEI